MAKAIKGNPDSIYNEGIKIEKSAKQARADLAKLRQLEGPLKKAWVGADADAFIVQFLEMMDEVEVLLNRTEAYGTVIKNAAVRYSQAQCVVRANADTI